jgi:hypothetical protein
MKDMEKYLIDSEYFKKLYLLGKGAFGEVIVYFDWKT